MGGQVIPTHTFQDLSMRKYYISIIILSKGIETDYKDFFLKILYRYNVI